MRRFFIAMVLGLAASAAALGAAADPAAKVTGFAPDPPQIAREAHWHFDLVVTDGVVQLTKVRAVKKKRPEATLRVMGRYALELRIGAELLDRRRFDVPLQGDGPREGRGGGLKSPTFTRVTTKLSVEIADAPRATYLALIDRATGAEQRFYWPPEADGSLVAWGTTPTFDAGAAADGTADAAQAPDDAAPPPPDGGTNDAGR